MIKKAKKNTARLKEENDEKSYEKSIVWKWWAKISRCVIDIRDGRIFLIVLWFYENE